MGQAREGRRVEVWISVDEGAVVPVDKIVPECLSVDEQNRRGQEEADPKRSHE